MVTRDPFYDDDVVTRRGCISLLVIGPVAFIVSVAAAAGPRAAINVALLWLVLVAAWVGGNALATALDPVVDDDHDDDQATPP